MKIDNLVIFDGECNFCNSIVNSLIKRDKNKRLTFTSLQSDYSKKLFKEYSFNQITNDTIVFVQNQELIIKSTAAINISRVLGFPYNISIIFFIIPKFVRDYIYDVIARNRKKFLNKKSKCIIPDNDILERFIY